MMIIQDENRLKEEEEEEQEQQEVKEEEQESSRMSTEMNSTVKAAAAAAAEEDVHDLSLSNGKKTVSPDLGKSANRRKQVKPNRVTNDEDGMIQRELIIDESNDLGNDHRSSVDEEISNHSSQAQLPSVPATQQQEAYCNLCERSFCNKYFLKTHLAKKHGVLNMVSPLSSADNHDNGDVAFSPPVSSSSCLSSESPAVPLIVQPPTPAMAPKSLEKFGEDYCEICQKRFCNKYYLRKHKGECHGIYTDYIKSLQKSAHESPMKTSASRRPSSTTSSISLPSNTLLLNPFYPGPSDMKSLYPISSSTSPRINDSPPLAQKQSSSQRSSRRCHLCEKEFRTKSLLRTHISTVHANGKLLPSTPLHPATNLSFLQPFLDSTSQLAQKVITGQTPQTSYGLVPDAYFCAKMADRVVCEFCNKQVCNKYFLKTHKAKVHGITQNELQEPSHDNSNRENSDTYCTLCKKDFSTKYFYLLHMHTMHQETNDATYRTFIEFLKTASNLDPSANLLQRTEDDDDDNDDDDEADGDTTDRSSRKRSHSSTDSAGAKRLQSLTEMNNGGLQPFLLESEDPSFSQTFVPCMVYLPVLRRVTKQVKINLRLKPVLGDTSA